MNCDERLVHTVAFTLVPRWGPVKFKNLLETGGINGISEAVRVHPERIREAATHIQKAYDAGVRLVALWDEDYPALLKEIYDPPMVLFVKGMLPDEPMISVVGSRAPSIYGVGAAHRIAGELVSGGAVVVSGLARGIDTAAHQGALAAGGLTIAVLGGGLSAIYPPENRRLAEKIAQNGALLSEYLPDTPAHSTHFPRRNRIISGLSRAVVVVEAKEKSGALITADAALEQGRDVYAVPGNIDSARSRGTNFLLKQGARPLLSARDIFEEFKPAFQMPKKKMPADLSHEESTILELIGSGGPVHADEVIEKSGFPAGRALSYLSTLSIRGLTKELPGKYYVTYA